ncbi:MAG: hypothetical protein WCI71_01305, partial [Bacteroidota bacterium]
MKKVELISTAKLTRGFYIFLMLLLSTVGGFSQNVGINATGNPPNANAGLDVDFASKGLLIPRVALTGTTSFAPLAAHVAGMIVYNTATTGDVTPGFYYNNGTRWIASIPAGTAAGDMLYWNGSAWVRVPAGTPGQFLQFSPASIPVWTGSAFIDLTTTAVTSIAATTATSGGTIVNANGTTILTRGVCFATTTNPTTGNTTVAGTAVSPFTCNLTGLTAGTIYYIRAYATNSSVVSYGNQLTFSTLPTLTTTAASLITTTTARTGGNVTTGNAPVIERGVCYGTTSNPTTASTKVIDPSPGAGAFISDLTGLVENTLYYVRSYAINAGGTAYGTQITLTTLSTLTTTAITSITQTSASGGGTIAVGGGASISVRGVCWSTSPNPTTALATKTNNGTGAGVFTSSITGLAGSTLYYVRAYATNAGGISYGVELSFTTASPVAPVITSTNAITNLSANTATTGGAISSDGGAAITVKGVCWSTSPNPVLGIGNFTSNGTGTASFVSNITGLTGSTLYYTRAYATNSAGTGYGPVDVSFTTWVQAAYSVGQNLGYGYCCYVNSLGGGLIVSYDIPSTTGWGCPGTIIGTGTAIGTGQSNTNLILAACVTRPIAASIADDYSITYNGVTYSDWYLPSSAEWATIATPYNAYGLGYAPCNFYTSSEYGSNTYATTYFNNGSQAYQSGAQRVPGVNDYIKALRVMRTFNPPALPAVTTEPAVTNIGGTTATSGGNVTSEGGATVSARGVCWSTVTGPTIANPKTTDGTGAGVFVSSITGLTQGTTYFVRAYATNIAGTSYGLEVSFTTAAPATLTTDAVTNIAATTATSGGNITNDGGTAVTARGVCWSTVTSPTISDPKTSDGTGTGTFVSSITGLTTGVPYFVRAYATTGFGTVYGNEQTFTPAGAGIPTVTTDPVTSPTSTGGTSGGNVTSDGGAAVTARGVCWNSTGTPAITDPKTTDGTGTGTFVSTISGLTTGVLYYIRAYATNSVGTAYGAEELFAPGIAVITTDPVTNPTSTGGTSGGNITTDGGSAITARGVCWNTGGTPTIADTK